MPIILACSLPAAVQGAALSYAVQIMTRQLLLRSRGEAR